MTLRPATAAITAIALLGLAACVPPPAPPGGGGTTTGAPKPPPPPTTTSVPGPPRLYKELPLDSWGQNGIANMVDLAGNSVYVGGDFSRATNGSQWVQRDNVMAVERTTGRLVLGFVANTNGPVTAIASDGLSVYIGGSFTTVNGVPRTHIAKLNAATGALDPLFAASAGNFVSDFLIWGNKLYVVGEFGQINGVARRGAAVVSTTTGALDPTFNPGADLRVNTVAMNPAGTSLYLGGVFTKVGGVARAWMAEVNPVTGKVQGPSFTAVKDYVRDLTTGPDGKLVYAAVGGGMNSAVALDAKTGKQKWRQHADGDVQAVKYSNGYVYFGFHDGFGGDTAKRILAANPQTGALNAGFEPESGAYPGVLTIDADGSYLAVGGYFNRMGGRATVAGVSIHPG